MSAALELTRLSKSFGSLEALRDISMSVPEGSVLGLIGRNGSGKTTLLNHVVGLLLPTVGHCETLGCPSGELGPSELASIGMVHQESQFLVWMRVEQHLRYVASFYDRWDRDRERKLMSELELDPRARVGTLSPGSRQKLAILLAVCHHPRLLILDEPVASMDPIGREQLIGFLLELLQEDGHTTLISSHALRDVERIVDRVVCLDRGELLEDSSLDALHERYSEWIVTSNGGSLPERFTEAYVLEQRGNQLQRQLLVTNGTPELEVFQDRHDVAVATHPMNLERIFPLLLRKAR